MDNNQTFVAYYMQKNDPPSSHESFKDVVKHDKDILQNKYLMKENPIKSNLNYVITVPFNPSAKQEYSKGKGIINVNLDKMLDVIENMEDNDDIRIQIQYVTRIIKQLDILYKNGYISNNKRKVIVLFRSILKLNCDNSVFSDKQLEEFKKILKLIRGYETEDTNLVLSVEKDLREAGLRTMVSWE